MNPIVKHCIAATLLLSLMGCGGSSKSDGADSSGPGSLSSVAMVSSSLVSSSSLSRASTSTSSSSSAPSSASSSVNPLGVARVVIDQTAVLLTQNSVTKQLSAKVTDSQGNLLSVPISWFSSRPNEFSVDSTGNITALVSNGASQIFAEVNGVKSAPVLVVVTKVPDNAVLLNDAQIVGEPTETTPAAEPAFTNTYDVNLTGVAAPAVGSLLINTESKMVAGRVVAVNTNGSLTKVTLGLVSLREMFPKLNVKEVIDLSKAEITPTPRVAALYDVVRTDNTFTYTPKAAPLAISPKRLQKTAAKELGPFTCERFAFGQDDTDALFEYELEKLPTFSVTINPSLDLIYTEQNGLERLVLQAVPTVDLDVGLKTALAVEAKVECKAELYVIRLPIGGALSLLIGGNIPIGVGFDFGGKLSVVDATVGASLKASSEIAMGLACPAGQSCSLVHRIENTKTQLTPRISLPSLQQVQFEPGLSGFAYAEMEIGSPILRTIRFTALEVKAGAKLEANFASVADQLASSDPKASSQYGVNLAFEVDLGKDLNRALELLGLVNFTDQGFEASTPIAQSPAGIAEKPVTADRNQFYEGEEVHFTVSLDTATASFFPSTGPYNVKKVQLIRKVGNVVSVVAEQDAGGAGHNFVFGFTYRATDAGQANEFSAFVVTNLLPFDTLALEIGNAIADPIPGRGVVHLVFDKVYTRLTIDNELSSSEIVDVIHNSFTNSYLFHTDVTYNIESTAPGSSTWRVVGASGAFNYVDTDGRTKVYVLKKDMHSGNSGFPFFGVSPPGTEKKGCTVTYEATNEVRAAGALFFDMAQTARLSVGAGTFEIFLPQPSVDGLLIPSVRNDKQTADECDRVKTSGSTSTTKYTMEETAAASFLGDIAPGSKGVLKGKQTFISGDSTLQAEWDIQLPR